MSLGEAEVNQGRNTSSDPFTAPDRKVDIRLHGKGNSNSHGARPVSYHHLDDKADLDQ
jgi:hypothetical protein